MNILVTGGAGFIGSHTIVELYKSGFKCIIIDNFSNSEKSVLDGIEKLIGQKPIVYFGDCNDANLLNEIFANQKIDGVIHFAASKAVGESVENPLKYYRNNVAATVTLLETMIKNQVFNLVFSSSCTVYGQPMQLPVTEETPVQKANSPYGNTKQICEEIIEDTVKASLNFRAISLRYFNPIGAHESTLIGELPKGIPANLIPFIMQVAAGIRPALQVFGDDYPTADGTCVRDYIHVVDLAKAHVAAIKLALKNNENISKEIGNSNGLSEKNNFYKVYNIGTGNGNTVLEVIKTFEEITQKPFNYIIKPRREGDVTAVYADVSLARNELDWKSEKTLKEALTDAWKWQLSLDSNHS